MKILQNNGSSLEKCLKIYNHSLIYWFCCFMFDLFQDYRYWMLGREYRRHPSGASVVAAADEGSRGRYLQIHRFRGAEIF